MTLVGQRKRNRRPVFGRNSRRDEVLCTLTFGSLDRCVQGAMMSGFLQAASKAVVRLIPAHLVGELPHRGVRVDVQQLDVRACCAKSVSVSKFSGRRERRVVRATGGQPGFGGRREAGRRPPHGAGDGQSRQRLIGLDDLDRRWRRGGTGLRGRSARPRNRWPAWPGTPAGPGLRGRRSRADGSHSSGCAPLMVGQTSSMWAPRIFGSPGPRWYV